MITNRYRLQPPSASPPSLHARKRQYIQWHACGNGFSHNHPSGDPSLSQADIKMTKAIVDVAQPLGISVHDHIIVGKDGYASLKGMRLF